MRSQGSCRYILSMASIAAAALVMALAASLPAQDAKSDKSDSDKHEASKPDSKFPAWDTVTKDAKKLDGLFPLYYNEKAQDLFMEISSSQYDKDILCPMAIARGTGGYFLGGDTLNFGDQWVIHFRRAGDRVLVIRPNLYFKAREGSPQADAVRTSYTDSVIASVPVKSEQGGKVLIDLKDLFMTDFAGLGVQPDRNRSTWGKLKTFGDNVEIEVNAVFSMRSGGLFLLFNGQPYAAGEVPDSRGTQIVMHYGLSMLPSGSYKSRAADDRVGYFLSVTKDYSSDADSTPFVRYVTRWQLEKADEGAALSPPKKPIVFWIEKSVPREYRRYVRDGILEWNKAFEKIGFLEAIEVRDQQSLDDFDPEDIRYNTFRWITTSQAFAMGPSRTNPRTGQILDADILFDEAMVRYWRQEYLRVAGLPQGLAMLAAGNRQAFFKLYSSEVPMFALVAPEATRWLRAGGLDELQRSAETHPHAPGLNLRHTHDHTCAIGPGMTRQLGVLAAVMSAQGKAPGGRVPEEYIGQALKEVTMHEVGHTLGLRHNFKASGMLTLEECNDTSITDKKGMAGSVMDYLPANIAMKGQKQGHYFSPTIGPYDYWAIEYAYKPISGSEEEELKKIASRVAEPDLAYGTDEDLYGTPDPRINLYDLGDPVAYARQRMQLAKENMKDLAERVVQEGDGWQRAREAFGVLLGEISQAAYLAAQFVGGEYVHRDHKGDPNARTPLEPIDIKKQRDVMEFLAAEILSDQAFQFSPDLLRRLAPDHWNHWGEYSYGSTEYPVYDQVASIQMTVLSQFLDGGVLGRIQNVELQAAPDQEVLKLHEVFDSLTKAIVSELPAADSQNPTGKLAVSTIRRNLQREYVKRLAQMVLGPRTSSNSIYLEDLLFFGDSSSRAPADARALARHHLGAINGRIKQALGASGLERDPYTQAHLEELGQRIDKVLAADLEVNDL